MKRNKILLLRDLTICRHHDLILDGIGLEIPRGTICALIGPSGSGKSILGRTLSALLPAGFRIIRGEMFFRGRAAPWSDLHRLRGAGIFYIPQNAQASLDPVKKIRRQIFPGSHRHGDIESCRQIFRDLDFTDPDRILDSYPFELSGGENQRVILSIALMQKPGLLILDEPVSGLDPELRAMVVDLIRRIRRDYDLTILMITHRLKLVSALSDFTYVIHQGRIVDSGVGEKVFTTPRHPFTRQIRDELRSRPDHLI